MFGEWMEEGKTNIWQEMTEEQEEAIKILSDSKILMNIQRDTALSIRVAIETVLNMLKENSAEIEKKNTELAEKNAEIEKLKEENKKLNKRLDEINKTNYPIIN